FYFLYIACKAWFPKLHCYAKHQADAFRQIFREFWVYPDFYLLLVERNANSLPL
ncbi:MAG: hypothetical protein RIS29_2028, partial [Bacteroidota bacterium]